MTILTDDFSFVKLTESDQHRETESLLALEEAHLERGDSTKAPVIGIFYYNSIQRG